jgi:hypothetical protein
MITATSLIIGEATRKENVTPKGTPASIKPKNSGIALQVQNGVMIPKMAAKIFPAYLCLWDSIFFIFCGGKNERNIDTVKIITASKIKIFMVSKIKKFTALPSNVLCGIEKTPYVSQSENNFIG